VAGRHPDVDDDQLGLVPALRAPAARAASPACPTTSNPDRDRRLARPFAQEDVVVGERHPGGGGRGHGCGRWPDMTGAGRIILGRRMP
jgi:hypothetical protein